MYFELVKAIYDIEPRLLDNLEIYEKVRTDTYRLFMSNILFVCFKIGDTYSVQSIVDGKVVVSRDYITEETAKVSLHHLALSTMRSLLNKLAEAQKDNV